MQVMSFGVARVGRSIIPLRGLLVLLYIMTSAVGAEGPTYKKDIAKVFKAKCTKCHGLLVKQKGLSLRNLKSIYKGGESGAVIVPGKPEASLLVKQLSLPASDPKRMPPVSEKAQLTAAEKQLIAAWIKAGAR